MSSAQPPPTSVPLEIKRTASTSAYFETQKNALYQLWRQVQVIPGLSTPYPISDGGTGSTTAAGARSSLGVYSTSEVDDLVEDSKRYAMLLGGC